MKKSVITLAIGVSITIGTMSCGSGADKNKQTKDSVVVHSVEVGSVTTDTISLEEVYTATLEAKVTNNISAQAGGRLVALLVKEGDRVGKGQVVARLDGTQLTQAQIQLSEAKTNFSRFDELYRIGGISKAQWEQAKNAMDIAQQTYNNLATNTILRSPISGVVTKKNYDNGDMTSPQLPVVVIEQISPVTATINVSEQHYTKLRRGMKVHLTVDAIADATYEARVSNIFPTIDTRTHTVAVEIEIANKDSKLRPGMYSRVRLDFGTKPATLVPDKAVQRLVGSGVRFVYVCDGGKAIYREIQIGGQYGDKYEVLSGIEAGTQVITSAVGAISNGSAVQLSKK